MYVFALLAVLTTVYLVSFYVCGVYDLERQVEEAALQQEVMQSLGGIAVGPDYNSVYAVRLLQGSQALLVILHWLYVSFYCCELLHLKNLLNLAPDHNYFMDRKQIQNILQEVHTL